MKISKCYVSQLFVSFQLISRYFDEYFRSGKDGKDKERYTPGPSFINTLEVMIKMPKLYTKITKKINKKRCAEIVF